MEEKPFPRPVDWIWDTIVTCCVLQGILVHRLSALLGSFNIWCLHVPWISLFFHCCYVSNFHHVSWSGNFTAQFIGQASNQVRNQWRHPTITITPTHQGSISCNKSTISTRHYTINTIIYLLLLVLCQFRWYFCSLSEIDKSGLRHSMDQSVRRYAASRCVPPWVLSQCNWRGCAPNH